MSDICVIGKYKPHNVIYSLVVDDYGLVYWISKAGFGVPIYAEKLHLSSPEYFAFCEPYFIDPVEELKKNE